MFVSRDGETWARIEGVDRLRPFLMTIPSDTDLWMFVSSAGGLTAGRGTPDQCLFPYETVDKLHDAHDHTGPLTLVRVRRRDGGEALWEPFGSCAGAESGTNAGGPGAASGVERRLYKSLLGTQLVFEEIRRDLGLAFRARWAACDAFGWVRTVTLENLGREPAAVSVLDGFRNVQPFGASLPIQQQMSSLVDAYKRSELDARTPLGIFSLTAQIVDRAEAVEVLHANTVWCAGLPGGEVTLGIDAVEAFRQGRPRPAETLVTGRRGNFLVRAGFELEPGASRTWHLAADVGRSQAQVAALRARLGEDGARPGEPGSAPGEAIDAALREAGKNLTRIVASADGLQLTAQAEVGVHHAANVLMNVMRGGVFAKNHAVPAADFAAFVRTRNRRVADLHAAFLAGLPQEPSVDALVAAAAKTGDPDLRRLAYEVLPLFFGRRHGDPSRPWNRFSIRVREADGTRALHYEGNWRDIFQNWEALALSFPGFLPGMIAKFVNASTVDGFNPYRVSRDGVDWEVVRPDEPWGNIGYWGDHQIVYLLRLLEAQTRVAPGVLESLLGEEIFSYAQVPYRLAPYEALLADPHDTITFDRELDQWIGNRVARMGTDGRLLSSTVRGLDGTVYHASLLEKLLVPALSKLSNLVPDGGIWMNTQRPEWNDANNALVGHGLSVVTLCHLRRYLAFLEGLLADVPPPPPGASPPRVSSEVVTWMRDVMDALEAEGSGKERLDAWGGAFSRYRETVYASGFSGKEPLPVAEARAFCRAALAAIDPAIRANRREDGLYHAYNLMERSRDGRSIAIRRLPEMLEGQVAALGSGVVGAEEAVGILAAMFESRLYRPAERSFLLYPEKVLPGFLEKNVIPEARVLAVPSLAACLESGESTILVRDAEGAVRFHPDLVNADALERALDRLAGETLCAQVLARDRQAVLDLYEATFHHHAFTGRSGTMYGYEGIGCIYWHMVAKLLLAVQELASPGDAAGSRGSGSSSPAVRAALASAYDRIRGGLGFGKTAAEYGAFPTDPYSHTPGFGGAQQPGMTGQVKEEILTRFGELGVTIEGGRVRFRPALLHGREFLTRAATFDIFDVEGAARTMEVPAGSLAFTFCQVPVVYTRVAGEGWVRVARRDGAETERPGDALDGSESAALLARRGDIARIDVGIPEERLNPA